MDTRTKIMDLAAVSTAAGAWRRNGGKVALTAGHFHVLDACAAAELRRAKTSARMLLVAVVVEHPVAVLAAGARAVMVAGLGMVDYVLTAENEAAVEAVAAALAPDVLVRCEASQRERLRQLIDYVHRRHSGTR